MPLQVGILRVLTSKARAISTVPPKVQYAEGVVVRHITIYSDPIPGERLDLERGLEAEKKFSTAQRGPTRILPT